MTDTADMKAAAFAAELASLPQPETPAGMVRVSKAVFYATVGSLNVHPSPEPHRTYWRTPARELLGITTPGYLAEGECAYFVVSRLA